LDFQAIILVAAAAAITQKLLPQLQKRKTRPKEMGGQVNGLNYLRCESALVASDAKY
jgi:hypothetical protein